MAQEWFYKFMGETVGPLSTSEFREHATDGRIQPDTPVTRDGTDDWVSADRIKGLFDADGVLLPPPENTGGQNLKRTPIENTLRKAEQSTGETKDAEKIAPIKWRGPAAVGGLGIVIAVWGLFQSDGKTD